MAETGSSQQESSAQPEAEIIKVKARSKEIVTSSESPTTLRAVGGATVLLSKDAGKVAFFDEKAEAITSLPDSTTIMDWTQWYNVLPPSNTQEAKIIRDASLKAQNPRSYTIDQFPDPDIKRYIGANLRPDGTMLLPRVSWKVDTTGNAETIVDAGDGYVLVATPGTENYILFQTKDTSGQDIPPRNWQRIDRIRSQTQTTAKTRERLNALSEPDVQSLLTTENGAKVKVRKGGIEITIPGQTPFADNLPGIDQNFCEDPLQRGVIYYCTEGTQNIVKVDTTKPPLRPELLDLPQEYRGVKNLRLDKSGNVFTFDSSDGFIIMTKDLAEISRVTDITNGVMDDKDGIHGIDRQGHLVLYETNLQAIRNKLEADRIAKAAEAAVASTQAVDPDAEKRKLEQDLAHLTAPRQTIIDNLKLTEMTDLTQITGINLTGINQNVDAIFAGLQGLNVEQMTFMQNGVKEAILARQRELAQPVILKDMAELRSIVRAPFTFDSFSRAQELYTELNSRSNLANPEARAALQQLEGDLLLRSEGFIEEHAEVIHQGITEVTTQADAALAKIRSQSALDNWEEGNLSVLRQRLGELQRLCPPSNADLRAAVLEAQQQILKALQVKRLAIERTQKKTGPATEKTARTALRKQEIDTFLARLTARRFRNRTQIETFLSGNDNYDQLKADIAELARTDAEEARALAKELKVSLALAMAEVERNGAGADGLVLVGSQLFPRWEKPETEEIPHKIMLDFEVPKGNLGPGVKSRDVQGDVVVKFINDQGVVVTKRIYQDNEDEDQLRFGSELVGSYVSSREFAQIRRDYADWTQPDRSKSEVRKNLIDKQKALRAAGDRKRNPQTGDDPTTLQAAHEKALEDYNKYCVDHRVVLLAQIDKLSKEPPTEEVSSIGYVPEWQSHWTIDAQTNEMLSIMAKKAGRQQRLEEGIINLFGHAGTGKDVLVKMFAHITNREYFGFDVSKWTTEADLSEDVTLDAEDGTSRIVKVPSSILQGIQTPGAIMYINEFNAMPEQAQIFLHSLLDEKRSLTLKTRGGETIKADPSVLFFSSMNPGYPGTFEPQFATKSRMVNVPVDYPPLHKEPGNASSGFSTAEALRLARGVKSLEETTYDLNLDHNTFVQMWDKHINGDANGAPDLNPEQKFDMETIKALVEFTDKLRTAFKDKFNKTRNRQALTVSSPLTARELRRCADDLSEMNAGTKATLDARKTAKKLLEENFLTNLFDETEKHTVQSALNTWT